MVIFCVRMASLFAQTASLDAFFEDYRRETFIAEDLLEEKHDKRYKRVLHIFDLPIGLFTLLGWFHVVTSGRSINVVLVSTVAIDASQGTIADTSNGVQESGRCGEKDQIVSEHLWKKCDFDWMCAAALCRLNKENDFCHKTKLMKTCIVHPDCWLVPASVFRSRLTTEKWGALVSIVLNSRCVEIVSRLIELGWICIHQDTTS